LISVLLAELRSVSALLGNDLFTVGRSVGAQLRNPGGLESVQTPVDERILVRRQTFSRRSLELAECIWIGGFGDCHELLDSFEVMRPKSFHRRGSQ
jgi:hypothetical protein